MDLKRAASVIDRLTDEIINRDNTMLVKLAMYGKLNRKKYNLILSKWQSAKGDFFNFYLYCESDVQRMLLERIGIRVEPDKYPDSGSRLSALFEKNKKRFEVFPFETEIVYQYFLFGYFNGLDKLKEISSSAWHTIKGQDINQSGNSKNWSAFWSTATQQHKEELLKYIIRQGQRNF